MCQAHTGACVSLLAPEKTDYIPLATRERLRSITHVYTASAVPCCAVQAYPPPPPNPPTREFGLTLSSGRVAKSDVSFSHAFLRELGLTLSSGQVARIDVSFWHAFPRELGVLSSGRVAEIDVFFSRALPRELGLLPSIRSSC